MANQKGGVAKTTSTVNLAAALKERGMRVLVVDLDPQSNLTMSFGIDPERLEQSMFDVLVHRLPIQSVIHQREVDVAAASIDLAGAELALSAMIGRERSLEKALSAVKSDYDFILIDTPPSLGLLTINAFTTSTGVIVPVQLESTLQMIREHLNPVVHIEGILPTMVEGRTVHGREALDLLQANFQDLVFETRIKKSVKLAEAPVQGGSVLSYQPDGAGANAYRALAEEVLSRVE
jgi:chromosome partitioning protein